MGVSHSASTFRNLEMERLPPLAAGAAMMVVAQNAAIAMIRVLNCMFTVCTECEVKNRLDE
jgi:hypothetical protein